MSKFFAFSFKWNPGKFCNATDMRAPTSTDYSVEKFLKKNDFQGAGGALPTQQWAFMEWAELEEVLPKSC